MKTSEFKQAMGNLGYMNVTSNKNDIQVYSYRNMGRGNGEIIWVSGKDQADFRFYYDGQDLNDEALKQASKTAIEYAFTPINEREDESKFYVRLTPHLQDSYDYWLNASGQGHIVVKKRDATKFTVSDFYQFGANNPQWDRFLRDYDPDNTDVFVPVEDD